MPPAPNLLGRLIDLLGFAAGKKLKILLLTFLPKNLCISCCLLPIPQRLKRGEEERYHHCGIACRLRNLRGLEIPLFSVCSAFRSGDGWKIEI